MSTELERTDDQLREVSVLNRITDKEMRAVATAENPFEAAMAMAAELYGGVDDITQELGNGFTLVEKDALVGERMVLIQWTFNPSEFDDGLFVSVAAVTASQKRVIFNDGSTGVRDQLVDLSRESGRYGGYMVPRGLRANTYPTCIECNRAMPVNLAECRHCAAASDKRGKATTYYLDVSAE